MKKISFPRCFLLAIFLMSCASRQAVKITSPPSVSPPVEEPIIYVIEEDSPQIRKYFILDDDKNIVVKGEYDDLEIIYNLEQARAESQGTFLVPFSVKRPESDEWLQDEFSWKPRRDAAGILLAFDDDFTEAWEKYFYLFDLYNAKVTFFKQGEYSSFSTMALQRGHDVGYHSMNHLNLPKVSREVFFEETLSQVEVYRNAGVPLTSFAYPYGLSEPWMHEELLKHYKILRGYGVTFRLYNSADVRKGYIISRAIDTILFKKDEDFEAAINMMLRTVKFIGGDLILPLTTHDISDSADWGIKPQRLQYLLQTAKDLQLNFYLYKDFS